MSAVPQLSPLSPPLGVPLADAARETVVRLQTAGHVAFWAGGCVRDLLLARTPKDYDIATDARPERVVALFPRALEVGKAFGVVRVPVADAWFEVATFRQDHAYHDGRRPESVTFADAAMDAERRDFTVNALFLDPVRKMCLDHVGGRDDLARRLIRAVGDPDARFREDHLRLLRAVRFAQTLGFELETQTAAAIRRHAALITRISPERIRDELVRIFTEAQRPGAALWSLDALGLLAPILPEVAALKAQAQPPEFHPEGDVLTHTAMMLDLMPSPSPRLAFAILLHDVGKPPTAAVDATGRIRFNRHAHVGADMAEAILRRLRFSNDDIAAIVEAVRGHMNFLDVPNMKRSTLRSFVGRPNFPLEMNLHRIDCLASHGKLDTYAQIEEFQRALADEPVLPPPWVTGRDVMGFGIAHGPAVGVWLRRAYEAQLDGRFPSREALLAWVQAEVARQ